MLNVWEVVVFNGSIHWKFAFIVWLLIQIQIDTWFNPIPFLIGSLFPDCDIKKSMVGKFFPMWLFCKHRGFTHSLQAAILFSLPIVVWQWKWGVLFFLGYVLHMMMDSGTPMGIKWIYKKKKPIRR